MTTNEQGYLHLSNGMSFQGALIGAPVPARGELVFTTGMVGYTKTLTDPSYFGQILVFTYPLLGNYGVPSELRHLHRGKVYAGVDSSVSSSQSGPTSGFESSQVHASGVLVSTHSSQAFHWRCSETFDQWLKRQGIPGLSGVDTRQLTQIIRSSPGSRRRSVVRGFPVRIQSWLRPFCFRRFR